MSDKCPLKVIFEVLRASKITREDRELTLDYLIEAEYRRILLDGESFPSLGVEDLEDLDMSKMHLVHKRGLSNELAPLYYSVSSEWNAFALSRHLVKKREGKANIFYLIVYGDGVWALWENDKGQGFERLVIDFIEGK